MSRVASSPDCSRLSSAPSWTLMAIHGSHGEVEDLDGRRFLLLDDDDVVASALSQLSATGPWAPAAASHRPSPAPPGEPQQTRYFPRRSGFSSLSKPSCWIICAVRWADSSKLVVIPSPGARRQGHWRSLPVLRRLLLGQARLLRLQCPPFPRGSLTASATLGLGLSPLRGLEPEERCCGRVSNRSLARGDDACSILSPNVLVGSLCRGAHIGAGSLPGPLPGVFCSGLSCPGVAGCR